VNIPVDHQAFDLMKHGRMGLIRVRTVGAAWYHDTMGRRIVLHGADLHW